MYLGIKFNYNFNFKFQLIQLLFSNAGLIFFDHPVVKQTSKEQFFQSNLFKLIDILLPKFKSHISE